MLGGRSPTIGLEGVGESQNARGAQCMVLPQVFPEPQSPDTGELVKGKSDTMQLHYAAGRLHKAVYTQTV